MTRAIFLIFLAKRDRAQLPTAASNLRNTCQSRSRRPPGSLGDAAPTHKLHPRVHSLRKGKTPRQSALGPQYCACITCSRFKCELEAFCSCNACAYACTRSSAHKRTDDPIEMKLVPINEPPIPRLIFVSDFSNNAVR